MCVWFGSFELNVLLVWKERTALLILLTDSWGVSWTWWRHFPRYWPSVRGIHRSSVNSPQKGQWRGALMFSLIYARINGWVNTGEAGDLRRHHAHYDVMMMIYRCPRNAPALVTPTVVIHIAALNSLLELRIHQWKHDIHEILWFGYQNYVK